MTVRRPDFPHISRTTTDQGSLSRPAAVPQPSPRNPPTANAEQAPKAPVALALADGLTRDLIRLRFECLGWQVLTVDDGRNALHLLQTRSLALILLDLWLPQINGLDVLRQARALQGQRFRFRVSPDGSTAVTGVDAWAGPAVGSLLSQLPATLPAEPVAPGATWNRSVDIPLAVSAEGKTTATLTAVFRLDSISRSGEFAYLSMKGRLVRSGPTQAGGAGGGGKRDGGFVQTSGSVTATLLLDRRRGWIADARTIISLRSLVTGKEKDAAPLRVSMKITQWMRVM